MSFDHFGEVCLRCGGDAFVPGTPQKDEHGRVIGYRYICANCMATAWTTWTEEYEAEIEAAKARHESESEALRRQKEEEACAATRARHAQMREWMQTMEAWAEVCPAVKKFLDRQIGAYGDMHAWTPAWTYQVTGTTYNAAKAIMEAVE